MFYGEGDQEPGKEPGDIVIQLEEKEHSTFQVSRFTNQNTRFSVIYVTIILQRHGKDLTLRLDIDVSEALCGMQRSIKTLDNRNIVLTTHPGEIIKQADIKMVQGEGMPTYRVSPSDLIKYRIHSNCLFTGSI